MGKKDCKCLKNKKCSSIACKLCQIPDEPIKYLNFNKSFREMAVELDILIDQILNDPLIKKFLENPYSGGDDIVFEAIYIRIIRNYCNIWVNDTSKIPAGFSRRVMYILNDGGPLLDVSTFNLEQRLLNYYICAPLFFINPAVTQSTYPQNNQHFNKIASNPNLINIDSCHFAPLGISNINISVKCGSPVPPVLSIEDDNVGESNFLSYSVIENHGTREEVQRAYIGKYGWNSRLSISNYKLNFYMARKVEINLNLGANAVLRISYFKN